MRTRRCGLGRCGLTDSTARLPELELPTLVLHSRGDQMNEFAHARRLAVNIKGARLVALESNNHIVLASEPAWPVLLREVTEFIAPDRKPAPPVETEHVTSVLSPRELDILALAAEGRDNNEIAAELVLSVRTVEDIYRTCTQNLGCKEELHAQPLSQSCSLTPQPAEQGPSTCRPVHGLFTKTETTGLSVPEVLRSASSSSSGPHRRLGRPGIVGKTDTAGFLQFAPGGATGHRQ